MQGNIIKTSKFICEDILEFLSNYEDHFDCVVVVEAIEHFDDDLGFVRLVYELLPRDGVSIFSVPGKIWKKSLP